MPVIGLAPQSAMPAGNTFGGPSSLSSADATCSSASADSHLATSTGCAFADFSSPILEHDAESSYTESPNEPATPASGRHSQDFTVAGQHLQGPWHLASVVETEPDGASVLPLAAHPKDPTLQVRLGSSVHPLTLARTVSRSSQRRPSDDDDTLTQRCLTNVVTAEELPSPLTRRTSRSTSSTIVRTMTNLFKRSGSSASVSNSVASAPNVTSQPAGAGDANSIMTADSHAGAGAGGSTRNTRNGTANSLSVVVPTPKSHARRWTMYRSSPTSRSHTPPSPSLSSEAPTPITIAITGAAPTPSSAIVASVGSDPNPDDFKKRGRVSSGLESIRVRVGLPGSHHRRARDNQPRRANSLETLNQQSPTTHHGHAHAHAHVLAHPRAHPHAHPLGPANQSITMVRQHLFNLPEEGVGLKARRMSLSLPDDFNVDVGNLADEYEYNSRFGRHGKHLGKGATSKVNVMVRKGSPGELYAVKEFRPRNSREDRDEYEKKVMSEYSIAKSLHHPNIVESFRLCTDGHGRWNHVMEYCSDGDLFSLVKKGYLKEDARAADRLCLFKQLVQGINYLHSHGIAHRDIKLENLLVTDKCKLKLTDFGISEVFSGIHPGLRQSHGLCGQGMSEKVRLSKGRCGSQPYMAPEILIKGGGVGDGSSSSSATEEHRYDPRAIDVWSSAVIMIYLTFGGGLWEIADDSQRWYRDLVKAWDKLAARQANQREEAAAAAAAAATAAANTDANTEADKPATSDSEAGSPTTATAAETSYPNFAPFRMAFKPAVLCRLLTQMLRPDPKQRISIGEVANNRWFKNIDCCQPESYEEPKPFDASKRGRVPTKVCCHNHLPPHGHGMTMPSLGKMPGHAGY